jgi:3',5'-cyclic AMP phosphodiesterase CpdA
LVHLSDLHFDRGNTMKKTDSIIEILDEKIKNLERNSTVEMIITGDCLNAPDKSYLNQFDAFQINLSKKANNIYSLLGNHDIKGTGFGYLPLHNPDLIKEITERIYDKKVVFLNDNIVLLLFNSNINESGSNGEIGRAQMDFFHNELTKIINIENKTIIVSLHHHIISTPDLKWRNQNLYNRIFSPLLKLNDADIFSEWLTQNRVKLVLNGHLHEPYFDESTITGLSILSCGSTGGHTVLFANEYICFNILKFEGNALYIYMYAVNSDVPNLNIIQTYRLEL